MILKLPRSTQIFLSRCFSSSICDRVEPKLRLTPAHNLMKKILLGLFLLILTPACFASNFFVRSGASGGNNGSDWNNAWNGWSSIQWGGGGVLPRDFVYVAGGAYTGTLLIGVSGAAGNVITIQRVRSTDTAATGAAGWNPIFDTTVVQSVPTHSTGILFENFQNPAGSYVTIDGRVPSGWVINYSNDSTGIGISGVPVSNVTLRYINVVGPGKISETGDTRALDLTPESGGSLSNLVIQHCEASGGDACMYLAAAQGVNNLLVEYSSFHDAGAVNAAQFHPNIVYCGKVVNSTFRYNKFYNIDVEGLFFNDPGNDNILIYGNLFYQGSTPPDTGRGIQFNTSSTGTNVKIYNNTFVALPQSGILFTGANHAGCDVKNNIFWQTGIQSAPGVTDDYNFWSDSTTEPHGISNGANPFVSLAIYNYRITATAGARNNGVNLGSLYKVDPDGQTRGADGLWDIGAYQYAAVPPPPTNLRAQ